MESAIAPGVTPMVSGAASAAVPLAQMATVKVVSASRRGRNAG